MIQDVIIFVLAAIVVITIAVCAGIAGGQERL